MGSKRKRKTQEVAAALPAPKRQQKEKTSSTTKVASPPISLDTSPFTDNPRGPELKREVQLYNDHLSSEDISERIAAANAIVSGLLGGELVEESTLQRHLERRLFRGLASGRKGARLGISVVLAEVLGQLFGTKDLTAQKYSNLTFDTVLGFLVAKTKPEGDLSGQEEKDHYLGLLFGLQSFVRAKILFGVEGRWGIILAKLLDLATKKPWIREECGWVILEALAQMNPEQAGYTLETLYKGGLAISPEGVGIWLTARNRFPDMKFPIKPWGQSANPLEHLKSLAKALKESSSHKESDKQTQPTQPTQQAKQAKQTGNWNPQLHFVWNLVLAEYAEKSKNTEDSGLEAFENFWKVAVDENLFSTTASRERKFWGFLLFQKMFQDSKLYEKLLPAIFSHNLVRCLINHVQAEDRFLNRAADKSLKVMLSAVESNPQILVTVLPGLIAGNGTYNFDKVTKTKTIEKLLSFVRDEHAETVIDILVAPTLSVEGSEIEKESDLRRQLLGDYILNLVRHFDVNDDDRDISWVNEIAVPMVAKIAYSKDNSFNPPVSKKTQTLFRNRLMSIFDHFLSELKGSHVPCTIALALKPDAVSMDENITEAKDSALSILKKLCKKADKAKSEEQPPLHALALLYSLVIFQLYDGESETISILDELKLCYDKLIRHKSTDDEEVDASEVLVELLLSFVSRPSALLRKVTRHVFSAFMTNMTGKGLKLITDILESSESLRGQHELFDQEPEGGEQPENEDEDEEMDSDVEVVDMNGEEGHLSSHLDDDEHDSGDDDVADDSADDQNDEEVRRLNAALAQALGTHALGKDAGEESDSDADMTDSEMMALDSKLVEIFSQRKKSPNKKQEQKDAKETMINFKSRVLDLLEIYVKKQASNPLAFGIILPLIQLIGTTQTKSLAEKAHNTIITFSKSAKKSPPCDDIDGPAMIKLMETIHAKADKDPGHMFAKAASTGCLIIASALYKTDKKWSKKLATVYRDTQVAVLEGKFKVQAVLFMEWANWCQSHASV